MLKPTTVDFETLGIEGRPDYPPMPVGVSIKYPTKKSRYYAWGHPIGNNCTFGEAEEALKKAWQSKDGLLFQNAKFDLVVASTFFDLPIPPWQRIHDTMLLLFLDDPHQIELGLKPSAERLLDLPPEEQDDVAKWLVKNQPIPDVKITKSKSSSHYFGRYIAHAPGGLVGKYANGDVDRTEAIFNMLWPKTRDRDMLVAYDRERKLLPILIEMEEQGLPIDVDRLRNDTKEYCIWREKIESWIFKRLKVDQDEINLDSGDQLVKAMINAEKLDPDLLPRTKTGKYSTSKTALPQAVTDGQLLGILKYRSQLNTCLNTFMFNWLRTAEKSGGLIFTTWNQVKSPSGDSNVGTRTGRLSSTPNFQNAPNTFKPIFRHDDPKDKSLPTCPLKGLPRLPKIRSYITPFKGEVLIDRDWSQQEPRILAHFDGGSLMDKYLEDPWIDFHDYAKSALEEMGKFYDRKPVKNTNLGLIYGMGVGKLAERNDMTVEEAGELKKAILTLYPGLKAMYQDMKVRAKTGVPIRTWGGREYYCEEPKFVQGRIREFDYKLVNVLIQGSAADCTKEALIRFYEAKKPSWKPLLNIHDELVVSVPAADVKKAMEVLRIAMESVEFDVPILSEGTVSETNWAELRDYDKKGVLI
jgi:DNA polymerase I-like protein with 3'-5' exonuclease and polymerase domains